MRKSKLKLFASQRLTFPDPRHTLHEGILEFSDDLRVERLLEAYSFGIFPWPHEDLPTLWYCPEKRGVLDFNELHVPRSLKKLVAKSEFTFSLNTCFDEVIERCARAARPKQAGTWITQKLTAAYKKFHRAGYAHSLEVWRSEELVGGIYGVYVAGVFCGESMFYVRPNASKLALLRLIVFLRDQGVEWIPALEHFGGKYISRDEFLRRLEVSKRSARPIEFKI
jgi:leucyl/phenylalanyl-tRNA---protein transferase